MENYLSTAFNLGYIYAHTDNEKSKEILSELSDFLTRYPDTDIAKFFQAGEREAILDKKNSRLDELKDISASKGLDKDKGVER